MFDFRANFKKPHFVFVDDEPAFLDSLSRNLRAFRGAWHMRFLDDPHDALEAVHNETIDVLVTDLKMPVLSGTQLVSLFNKISPETRCIAISGNADLKTANILINELDIFRFFIKPFDFVSLLEACQSGVQHIWPLSTEQNGLVQHSKKRSGPTDRVLDMLPQGLMVLAPSGKVLSINRTASGLVAAGEGLFIGIDGELQLKSEHSGKFPIKKWLNSKEVADSSVVPILLERSAQKPPLRLLLVSDDASEQGCRFLFVNDEERIPIPSVPVLKAFFELTHSEARLAAEIACGRSVAEAAKRLNVTVSSARTYLKGIMFKTGTHRQAELVRLLLSVPTAARSI